MKETCDDCGGTGLVKCGVCGGTGMIYYMHEVLTWQRRWKTCNHCTSGDKICPSCRGTGRKSDGKL